MKKIDKLLLNSSLGPFAAAFFIAVFVLAVVIDILILLVGRLITPWARVRGAS